MKKFRYDDPSLRTPWQRARPFLLIFIGWNLIGYVTWHFVNRKAAEKDPGWEARSESEKIAIIYGSTPSEIVKRKVTLFKSSESEEDKS